MAVKYFCDRCGTETAEGELLIARLSIPPDTDITMDLCSGCSDSVKQHFASEGADETALSRSGGAAP
jgi:hypothetical protein